MFNLDKIKKELTENIKGLEPVLEKKLQSIMQFKK